MSNKALFLDRDGVINQDKGYVGKPEDVVFVEGIFDVIRYFCDKGYIPIIVTNQSGIGRGYYTEAEFQELCTWMQQQFTVHGLPHIAVYYCPHHPTDALPEYLARCECRKPQPGMLLRAADDYQIALSESILIGDSWRDIEAGYSAGLHECYYVSEHDNRVIPSTMTVTRVNSIAVLSAQLVCQH